jgi:hypothetical protein
MTFAELWLYFSVICGVIAILIVAGEAVGAWREPE